MGVYCQCRLTAVTNNPQRQCLNVCQHTRWVSRDTIPLSFRDPDLLPHGLQLPVGLCSPVHLAHAWEIYEPVGDSVARPVKWVCMGQVCNYVPHFITSASTLLARTQLRGHA